MHKLKLQMLFRPKMKFNFLLINKNKNTKFKNKIKEKKVQNLQGIEEKKESQN